MVGHICSHPGVGNAVAGPTPLGRFSLFDRAWYRSSDRCLVSFKTSRFY